MTPEDLDELLGAYALDAVDEDERHAVEQYITDNPRARAEVEQYQEVAALLVFSGGEAPTGVWDRISAVIDGESESGAKQELRMPPIVDMAAARERRRTRRPWYALG